MKVKFKEIKQKVNNNVFEFKAEVVIEDASGTVLFKKDIRVLQLTTEPEWQEKLVQKIRQSALKIKNHYLNRQKEVALRSALKQIENELSD